MLTDRHVYQLLLTARHEAVNAGSVTERWRGWERVKAYSRVLNIKPWRPSPWEPTRNQDRDPEHLVGLTRAELKEGMPQAPAPDADARKRAMARERA